MDFNKLNKILESGTKEELTIFLSENNLLIIDGKIVSNQPSYVDSQIEYWDKRQLVKKINLNS